MKVDLRNFHVVIDYYDVIDWKFHHFKSVQIKRLEIFLAEMRSTYNKKGNKQW